MVLTPEPIGPSDDAILRDVLEVKLKRMRVVPFGLIRVNLGQEAIALAIHSSPDGLFPEPMLLGRCALRTISPLRPVDRHVSAQMNQLTADGGEAGGPG